MPQRTIRFSEALVKGIDAAARERGFPSPVSFIRFAVEQEIDNKRQEESARAEERSAASFDQVHGELFRLRRAQQALFAYVDTLSKTILTCMPEPPADARPQAVARAKERYDRLLKSAGAAMNGDSRTALLDLVSNGSAEA